MNLEQLFASAPSVRVVAKKSVLSENFEDNRCVFDAIIRDTRVFVFEHHNKKVEIHSVFYSVFAFEHIRSRNSLCVLVFVHI